MKFTFGKSKLRLRDIQLIALDFDGIFTDDKVYVDENGVESVACSRFDSLGVAKLLKEIELKKLTTRIIVISTETNQVVTSRCKKMNLQAFTGITDKSIFVRDFARTHNINLDYSLYAGNDINDYSAMMHFGARFAPANAHPRIQRIATCNLRSFGGNGFVRELIEKITPEAFSIKN